MSDEKTPGAGSAPGAMGHDDDDINRPQHTSKNVGGLQADNTAERLLNKPKSFTGDLHHLPSALAPLITLPHWVLWRWEKAGDKFTKVPYQPNDYKARNNDPKTWSSYDTVMSVVANFDG